MLAVPMIAEGLFTVDVIMSNTENKCRFNADTFFKDKCTAKFDNGYNFQKS
jgi:hypothetical protein